MAAQQPRFVRCPSCQWGTLADGNFCAYCGQPLRQMPPQPMPPQQRPAAGAASSGYRPPPGAQPQYYQPDPRQSQAPGGNFMQGGGGTHGQVTCPSCGTPNDPWQTHCKQCTRPLMTSG